MDKKIAAPQEKGDHLSTTAELNCTIKVLSGHGQFDKTCATRITYEGIRALVDTPQQVDKRDAQWLIPSTLPSRVFKDQEANGEYWFLWADIDKDPPGLRAVEQAVESATEMFSCYEIYTTRSATEDCQKCRIIIPLGKPLSGSDWKLSQECLNDMLEHLDIIPDRANERCAQLCYLPNKGAFYDSISNRDGNYFEPLSHWGVVLADKKQALREAQKLTQERIAESKAKREQRLAEGFKSLIEAFNGVYTVEDILLQACYDQRGNTFRHPNSEGGSYSASLQEGRVHSLSSADPLYTDGGGVGAHDAFSAFEVLFHAGDRDAALKDAGDHWLGIRGESWNKVRQRDFMEKKALQSADFDDERGRSNCPLARLNSFAANGKSAELELQMLDDQYVLENLAILGQWSVFYASPNVGKTLLTLWLLREAVAKQNVNGADVYYCNCDDSYKGGVEKLKIAEQAGFQMLIPGQNNFRPDHIVDVMLGLSETQQAQGKVIVLDTLKKFTDLMDKAKSSEFGKVARMFTSAGGSIVCLAHVNKNKDDSGKSVHAGTSDIQDDADCVYIIEKVSDTLDVHTVEFVNSKQRGDTALKQSFQYTKEPGADYMKMFDSVERISEDKTTQQKAISENAKQREKDAGEIRQIKRVIEQGAYSKTELVKRVMTEYAITRQRIHKLLERYETPVTLGGQWLVNVSDKNRHTYINYTNGNEDN